MNNKYTTDKVSSDMITMMVKQMGAKEVKSDPAHINIYHFELVEGVELIYKIDIRSGKGMYLHRITPYPILLGKFYGETDIIEYIKRDLAKFSKACNSKNFDRFIETTDKLSEFNRQIEQLFLNRNVPYELMDKFLEDLDRVHETIEEIAAKSPMLYEDERPVGLSKEDRDMEEL